jgi:hypothetical protein
MRKKRREPGVPGYYDNSLVVYGHRVAATHHPKWGWLWFFEDQARAPVKGDRELKNIRTLEDEVRAALPADFVAAHEAMNAEYGPSRFH